MQRFWPWLLFGTKQSPCGLRNIINKYIVVHIIVAVILTIFIGSDPFMFAQKALFPACSILIGISFAWSTRASTILQNEELRERLFKNGREAEAYVYGFQLSILVVMFMVVYVAIMAGGGLRVSVFGDPTDCYTSKFFLYFLMSLTMRECWGIVDATNMLSLLEYLRTR